MVFWYVMEWTSYILKEHDKWWDYLFVKSLWEERIESVEASDHQPSKK